MENWEFLLQRKGDKSWLPLESPSVEIVEGQYRLAARSGAANAQVGIAIAYRPIADVRHQPLQQKIVKRISHDGLMIVMPYTNLGAGLWRIECSGTEPDAANVLTTWKKTVEFDVIQVSSEFGSEWQYNDFQEEDEDIDNPTELTPSLHTNALGIALTEPAPLNYSSPILDIAEQRSTELVQSMFDEFALFDDEGDGDDEVNSEPSASAIAQENPLALIESTKQGSLVAFDSAASSQPRILLQLQQPQYIVDENNIFTIAGEAYTSGEIEVILKHPQTLEVIFNNRYAIAPTVITKDQLSSITINSINRDRLAATGAIPFAYQVSVPPPSEIQVLIGEVRIHPQQNFEQYSELFVMQQMIAVSYPASRVLPELIKEAKKYESQDNSQNKSLANSQVVVESPNSSSYPQSAQSSPQAESTKTSEAKAKSANWLSLPPLPSKNPKVSPASKNPQDDSEKSISSANSISLPIITNKTLPLPNSEVNNLDVNDDVNDLDQLELEFADTDIWEADATQVNKPTPLPNNEEPELNNEEPELIYSFEEELPQNYDELLEKPRRENLPIIGKALTPNQSQSRSPNRGNRFLNKLQTLSAEAIANQKASQRNEDLVIDTRTELALSASEDLSGMLIQIDNGLGVSMPITTIAEANSLAELDLELDLELDRLLNTELDLPDLILNEYVWEEAIDANTFPVRTLSGDLSNSNLSSPTNSALSETALTIRNLQESSSQTVSEQQEIPTPNIIIPEGEIISGTPMIIAVRLPAIAPKFFVKFWIKDLQTRTIVDGPRWLLDFSIVPDTDLIETRTNISIPLSSIDVAFEAIAIEAQTQRESHKVRVIRAVIPPNFAEDRSLDV
ncbi:MAG: hypothetical protein ACOYN8_03600 [Pseudanabaena sp.]